MRLQSLSGMHWLHVLVLGYLLTVVAAQSPSRHDDDGDDDDDGHDGHDGDDGSGSGSGSESEYAYQNPIRLRAPDPSIVFAGGSYSIVYTSDRYIAMTRAPTLNGLLNGDTRVFWNDSTPERARHLWAPELHRIDDVWYVFYSACDIRVPCCETCKTRVLRGCGAASPYDCPTYTYQATLVPEVGRQGGRLKDESFSIDGTYLEIPGKGRYHVVSARAPGGVQSIMITELDTKRWKVKEWFLISTPDQSWESNATNSVPSPGVAAIEEAPHPLYHGKDIWLTFSAASCVTPNYAIGLLYYKGGDPLDRDSWEKSIGPVFRPANGLYGTGHNCNFLSPDGKEVWNAFHATNISTGHCGDDRFTLAQKIEFDENNWPIFGRPEPVGQLREPPSGEGQYD